MSANKSRAQRLPDTPGTLLKRQRTAQDLPLSQVAAALHLSPACLVAIEADDYAALPRATYVLGYWRNYAKLLDISIDAAIAAHKTALTDGNTHSAFNHHSLRAHEAKNRYRAALVSSLLCIVFVAAVWFARSEDNALVKSSFGRWLNAQFSTDETNAAEAISNGQEATWPVPNFSSQTDSHADTWASGAAEAEPAARPASTDAAAAIGQHTREQ